MNPAPRPSSDLEARERIRTSLDESLIVEASAGTGKTTQLVRRIVEVLATGRAQIQQVAAVTFTHKAAGEMKLRLRQELDERRQDADPARKQALEDALERLEEAAIGTIHSFCAQILRERPVEANIDPAFEELPEQEAARIYQKAFRSWLERSLNQDSPGLRRAFARLAWRDSWDDSSPFERLQSAGWKLIEWRDYPAAWRRAPFARSEEIDTLMRMVRNLADLSSQPRRRNDNLYLDLQPARDLAGWIEVSEAAGPRDYDALESRLIKLGRDLRKSGRKGSGEYGGGVDRATLISDREELIRWIGEFRTRADAELAWLLREEMTGLGEEYSGRKRRQGKLDFVDLLCGVRNLLKDQKDVRKYLQDRFKYLFVDEFQDTDPLQAEILLLLGADDPNESDWMKIRPCAGKLFLVGDPKQSIYKFRRADLVLYGEVRRRLEEHGVGCVTLTRSFRSVPNIQQFVNASFETEMSGDVEEGHAPWAPLERDRTENLGRPSVIALPVPKPYGRQRLSKQALADSLPDAIGAFVDWLINHSGWGFRERDVAVLFRKRNYSGVDLTRETVRALEARGVPHLLAGSKSLHRREEVETLRAALTAIEWPDDELSVFAALKGSLFAIADETLFLYRHHHGRLHPLWGGLQPAADFSPPPAVAGQKSAAGSRPPVEEALSLLAGLHRMRNRRPFAATVNALLEATRAHAGFLLRPGGRQILANVGRVAELARTYETTGGISFRGFVEELAEKAEKEEAAEAPVLEEDSDGVRLMTVHSAKGLEFPVVILADPMTALSRKEPEHHIDGQNKLCAIELLGCAPWELRDQAPVEAKRERAEGVRIAYVAATRARDLLVIPAVGDEPFPRDGWLSPLNKALYPDRAVWRKSVPAEGCPAFGQSSVVERPLEYDHEPEGSVKPGLIQPEAGTHQVVWWDPFKLRLGEEQNQKQWQDRVLKRTLEEDGESSLAAYRAWREGRDQLLAAAAKPSVELFLASQAAEAPPELSPIDFVRSATASRSVSGRRFGALVHAILRDVPLGADPAAVSRFAELNARVLGAPPEETEAARSAAEAALANELLSRARAAARLHREYPLSLRLQDGRCVEGIIDLAFLENGKWIVVDFKTDADSAPRRQQYETQLQWYVYALSKLTNTPARGVLLGV
ncbi:MAG: UvrD-helicase domain-containing protein [Bryobacterales bacterium]|nr:UvrD-helicase domain-containing protein [Bryobacterales bacterium]MBV9401108.1 UvrD-helicase domain-containing protein [Bryobacterales bacterium]